MRPAKVRVMGSPFPEVDGRKKQVEGVHLPSGEMGLGSFLASCRHLRGAAALTSPKRGRILNRDFLSE